MAKKRILDFIYDKTRKYTPPHDLSADEIRDIYDENHENIVFIKQLFINPELIIFNESDNYDSKKYWPNGKWHDHSEEDFDILNNKLAESTKDVNIINDVKSATKFIRKYPEVYKHYYKTPILIRLNNGQYEFFQDGRHRIYSAQKNCNKIPVFVFEYRFISFEEFQNHYISREWKFY